MTNEETSLAMAALKDQNQINKLWREWWRIGKPYEEFALFFEKRMQGAPHAFRDKLFRRHRRWE